MADDIAGFHARRYDTTTSMGRLFFTTIAALAQLERDQISERTRMELAHKKSKGQRVSGRIPYGSRLAADGVNLVDAGAAGGGGQPAGRRPADPPVDRREEQFAWTGPCNYPASSLTPDALRYRIRSVLAAQQSKR